MKRGDVVLADFPFQDVPGSKVRPAVVVQNDADNQALANTHTGNDHREPGGCWATDERARRSSHAGRSGQRPARPIADQVWELGDCPTTANSANHRPAGRPGFAASQRRSEGGAGTAVSRAPSYRGARERRDRRAPLRRDRKSGRKRRFWEHLLRAETDLERHGDDIPLQSREARVRGPSVRLALVQLSPFRRPRDLSAGLGDTPPPDLDVE